MSKTYTLVVGYEELLIIRVCLEVMKDYEDPLHDNLSIPRKWKYEDTIDWLFSASDLVKQAILKGASNEGE